MFPCAREGWITFETRLSRLEAGGKNPPPFRNSLDDDDGLCVTAYPILFRRELEYMGMEEKRGEDQR